MGIIRQATAGSFVGIVVVAGYIRASTAVISPVPNGDILWTSPIYKRHNKYANTSTNDICIRQIPLEKIRPELLQKDGDLALELCRGVWSGWGEGLFMFSSLCHHNQRCVSGNAWNLADHYVLLHLCRLRNPASLSHAQMALTGDGITALVARATGHINI